MEKRRKANLQRKHLPMKPLITGILAHVDAGKTTLSEAMLYCTGRLKRLGRVDHRDSFLDTHSLERARGITIFSKQARLTAGNTEITLLDTPGHVDFSPETERTLPVLDCAVLVISGTDGVQAHTLTLWQLLRRYHVPTFLFINKMDLPGCDAAGRPVVADDLFNFLRESAAVRKTAHGRKRARKSEKNGQDSQFMRAQRPKEARQP